MKKNINPKKFLIKFNKYFKLKELDGTKRFIDILKNINFFQSTVSNVLCH